MGRVVALKVSAASVWASPKRLPVPAGDSAGGADFAPEFVMAYDADQHGDVTFFAMEFVAGIDLAKFVRRKPAAVTEVGIHPAGCDWACSTPTNADWFTATSSVKSSLDDGQGRSVCGQPQRACYRVKPDKPGSSGQFPGRDQRIMDLGPGAAARGGRLGDNAGRNQIALAGLIVGTHDFLARSRRGTPAASIFVPTSRPWAVRSITCLNGQAPSPTGHRRKKSANMRATPAPGGGASFGQTYRPGVSAPGAKAAGQGAGRALPDTAELAAALEPFSLETASANASSGVHRVIPRRCAAETRGNGEHFSQVVG